MLLSKEAYLIMMWKIKPLSILSIYQGLKLKKIIIIKTYLKKNDETYQITIGIVATLVVKVLVKKNLFK